MLRSSTIVFLLVIFLKAVITNENIENDSQSEEDDKDETGMFLGNGNLKVFEKYPTLQLKKKVLAKLKQFPGVVELNQRFQRLWEWHLSLLIAISQKRRPLRRHEPLQIFLNSLMEPYALLVKHSIENLEQFKAVLKSLIEKIDKILPQARHAFHHLLKFGKPFVKISNLVVTVMQALSTLLHSILRVKLNLKVMLIPDI